MKPISVQDAIYELLRMKKGLQGPQGCSVQSQEANDYKARCLGMAISALILAPERPSKEKP